MCKGQLEKRWKVRHSEISRVNSIDSRFNPYDQTMILHRLKTFERLDIVIVAAGGESSEHALLGYVLERQQSVGFSA